MVETKEETTTNDFPLYNGGQGGEDAMGAVVYPERPGEQECQYYLKTGTCKYATKCKFHHPPDVTPTWAAVAPATDVTVGLNKESYPRRPGEQQCTFFLKTGTCKYKMSCKFDHPPEAIQQTLQLQSTPYPVRPGEQHCTYYLKTGKCKFGATCRFDHPPMAPEQAAALAAAAGYPPQSGMPGADGRGMAMGMGPPRGPQGMMGGMAYYSPHDPNMMGLVPAPGPMGYGGPAATAAMLPQRPGEKECTFFLRTGRCQYGARCKYHHPLEKLAAITGGAMPPPGAGHAHPGMHPHAVAHGHGLAPGVYPGAHPMDPAAAYGGYGAMPPMRGAGGPQGPGGDPSLPSRPGADACTYYLRTGKCSYGSSCRYDHPHARSNSSSRETSDSGATSGSATSGQGQAGGAAGANGQGGAYGVGLNGQGAYPGGTYGEPGGVYGQGAGAEAYGGAAGGFVAYHQYPGQAPPVYASYRQAS